MHILYFIPIHLAYVLLQECYVLDLYASEGGAMAILTDTPRLKEGQHDMGQHGAN